MNSSSLLSVYGLCFQRRSLSEESSEPRRSSESTRLILDEVTWELNSGEFIALLGPNGSGKSTLLKLLAGLVPFDQSLCSGGMRYRNSELSSFSLQKRAQVLTYVAPDFSSEFPLTVEEAVHLGRICHRSGLGGYSPSAKDHLRVREAMEMTQCLGLRHRELRSLSGGERQWVGLARAIAQESRILLLDEALSKMDLNHQVLMGNLLAQLVRDGKSVILVSHDLNLASQWANRLWLMKQGKLIFDGSLSDGFSLENFQKLYPQTALSIWKDPETQSPKVFFRG